MAKMEGKSFSPPDEVRTFDKGKLEIINIGGRTIGRATFSRHGGLCKGASKKIETNT